MGTSFVVLLGEGGEGLMRKAIRDQLRDFLAILGLLTVGLLATYIIVQN